MKKIKTFGVVVLALFSLFYGAVPRRAQQKLLPPPAGTLYHGVYPGGPSGDEDDITPELLAEYENAVGI